MTISLVALWKQDTALNSYIFCLFLIGLPFTIFATYVIYQLQVVGYLIGTDADGQPCIDYCLVPFGGQELDLNSAILYLNAMGFGLGGACSVLISAYADFWKNKSVLVTLLIICYGAISVPVYWLKDISLSAFNSLMALYVVYAVITYILSALLCMYIPHCMRAAKHKPPLNLSGTQQTLNKITMLSIEVKIANNELEDETKIVKPITHRKYGLKMSILGGIGTTVGGILALVLVIILSQTLSGESGQTAGLLITTVFGFVTILGSVIAYLGLPVVSAKESQNWKVWWLELFTPFRDLLHRKNMLVLLLSYTIYTDTVFALNSVTAQLYFTEIKPDTLEYSLYAMSGNIFIFICSSAFYVLQIWRPPFKLEYWLVLGYALILVVPIWGCIGLGDNINFGFKKRWEFYVQSLIFNLSGSIVNPTFRVLFSELVPKGSEIEWFGLQVVLSCATAWVSYITNAPLQNATHQLRFPLVLCLIFLIVPIVLEVIRSTVTLFARDKLLWQEHDVIASSAHV
ncbi:autophagy-related protein 22-like protein [Amylocarpus encephaloides]|uniref:Autophagy-related protein n=1 Tax=Amylocarpus encephaloides TaxID=45428 RepID=A0A9P8C7I5_9HELO|nr:autophagy-related protein 22-like protein [Amylocarpus encephaloides]